MPDMPVDRHIVGRVREDKVGSLARHQGGVVGRLARVTADQPMAAQDPDIAALGDGLAGDHGDLILRAGRRVRVYMSATLGEGGDLERLTGRTPITRVPAPEGWDRQGIGRRFFIFPAFSLNEDEAAELRVDLMKLAGRSLVAVPSDKERAKIEEIVNSQLGFATFSAGDIEESKKPFIEQDRAAGQTNRPITTHYTGFQRHRCICQ